MKAKHTLYIFLLGAILIILGSFLKIVHFSYGNSVLAFGAFIEIIGALLFGYKLLIYPKFKGFLDK